MNYTPRIVLALSLLFLVAVTGMTLGCAHQKPHPNQINDFDGNTWESLMTAQATLDQAKAEYANGKLPVEAKQYLNTAGGFYNTAMSAYLSWRDIATGKIAGDAGQAQIALTTDLLNLSASIGQLQSLLKGGK